MYIDAMNFQIRIFLVHEKDENKSGRHPRGRVTTERAGERASGRGGVTSSGKALVRKRIGGAEKGKLRREDWRTDGTPACQAETQSLF